MKLVITRGEQQIFEANILLFDPWAMKTDDGQCYIGIDAMLNKYDTMGNFVRDQADIELFGTHEELQAFLENISLCVNGPSPFDTEKDTEKVSGNHS